jgi:hypothetical protein
MKLSALLLLTVLLISCQSKKQLKARFEFTKISQTTFNWHWNDSLLTRTFYINYYIECDSNGYCLIAKRDSFLSSIRYYQSILPITFDRLFSAVDFATLDNSYEPKDEDHSMLYCGFPYCFTVENKQHLTKYIRIIPVQIDSSIIKLVKSIEKIVYDSKQYSTDTIDLNPISNYIQTTLVDTSKFVPIVQTIKFTEPK